MITTLVPSGTPAAGNHYPQNLRGLQSTQVLSSLPKKTSLNVVVDTTVLMLADGENLSYGLRKQGLDLDYRRLLHAVRRAAQTVEAHAFACLKTGDAIDYARKYFDDAGWKHSLYPTQQIRHCGAIRRRSNCDPYYLLGAGEALARSDASAVILATGDGDLAGDVISHLRARDTSRKIVILGIKGCISRRLYPCVNHDVAAVIHIGQDIVETLPEGCSA